MCEVWKWLSILTTIPIVIVLAVDQVKWFTKGLDDWVGWWAPRLRHWWVGIVVWFVSVTMYVLYCE